MSLLLRKERTIVVYIFLFTVSVIYTFTLQQLLTSLVSIHCLATPQVFQVPTTRNYKLPPVSLFIPSSVHQIDWSIPTCQEMQPAQQWACSRHSDGGPRTFLRPPSRSCSPRAGRLARWPPCKQASPPSAGRPPSTPWRGGFYRFSIVRSRSCWTLNTSFLIIDLHSLVGNFQNGRFLVLAKNMV